jgi:glycosyltransferase involved in cell wall biosynthesis
MRVVMPILEYHPVVGGAQRQLRSLAPLLEARGVEVHVVTRAVPGQPTRERFEGAEIHRLPAPGPKALASLVWTACALQRIGALEPDVIHAFSLFSPATIAVAARRLYGTPSLVKILRGGEGGDVERLLRKTGAGLRRRAIARSVSRFVTISDEIDRELESAGVAPAARVRIPNGVDLERFRPATADEKQKLRARLGLDGGPLVVQCGRQVPEKRIDLLLDVWPRVRERVPGASLVLVGSGPCEAELRARAREGVRLVGEVDDVADHLRAADVFALPSRAEGLSNAILEAMAAGLAVVATAVGGALDVIDDGESGRLVPIDDADALVAGLVEALEPTRGAALGGAAREKMVKHYALDRVADRLTRLYEDVARERVPRAKPPTEEVAR